MCVYYIYINYVSFFIFARLFVTSQKWFLNINCWLTRGNFQFARNFIFSFFCAELYSLVIKNLHLYIGKKISNRRLISQEVAQAHRVVDAEHAVRQVVRHWRSRKWKPDVMHLSHDGQSTSKTRNTPAAEVATRAERYCAMRKARKMPPGLRSRSHVRYTATLYIVTRIIYTLVVARIRFFFLRFALAHISKCKI